MIDVGSNTNNWIYYVVGSIVPIIIGLWKWLSVTTHQALLEQRINRIEQDYHRMVNETQQLENKMTEHLNRIEAKLDGFILKS